MKRVARLATIVAVLVLGALAGVAAFGAISTVPGVQFFPVAHSDPSDTTGPLDLTSVTFGQQDTELVLSLSSGSTWSAGSLSDAKGRTLCLILSYGPVTRPRSRICVVSTGGGPATAGLSIVDLDASGAVSGVVRKLSASVSRPDNHTLTATFTPLSAGMAQGPFAWQVVTDWTNNAACPAPVGCVDRVPDHGRVSDTVSLLAEPPCFGAAARDPEHPCTNPALKLAVVPTPDDAVITPNAFCDPAGREQMVSVCSFGVTQRQSSTTIVLAGDSHAAHWRGALEVVAQARRWHGLSITRSGCPLTVALPVLNTKQRAQDCVTWNAQLRSWLTRHPSVSTIVTSAHAAVRFAGSVQAQYQEEWRRLPATVKHIIVIRDTPAIAAQQVSCINHAITTHLDAGTHCAQARSADLPPDPNVAAALALNSPLVKVVDLTRYMCNAALCFPVVGGALVRKDATHLTRTFSTSLGPYLLREINRVDP